MIDTPIIWLCSKSNLSSILCDRTRASPNCCGILASLRDMIPRVRTKVSNQEKQQRNPGSDSHLRPPGLRRRPFQLETSLYASKRARSGVAPEDTRRNLCCALPSLPILTYCCSPPCWDCLCSAPARRKSSGSTQPLKNR